MWIGENAIPCTPGVATARTRAKFKHKIKNTDEELMKLAKQFDQNLVDAIQEQDHQDQAHILACEEMPINMVASGREHVSSLPDKVLGGDIALSLHPIKENTDIPFKEQCKSNSQISVDQETEAAFNALFDSSPQMCSGPFSQGLSDGSQKSPQGKSNLTETKKENAWPAENIQHSTIISDILPHSLAPISADDQHPTPKREHRGLVPKQNVLHTTAADLCNKAMPMSSSKDDFEDDWGNDLLEDSFLMQITQNPELMKTPQNKIALSKFSPKKAVSGEDRKHIVPHHSEIPRLSKPTDFQFGPSKSFKESPVSNSPSAKLVHTLDCPSVDSSCLQITTSSNADGINLCGIRTNPSKLNLQTTIKPEDKIAKQKVQPLHLNVTSTLERYPNHDQSGNNNRNSLFLSSLSRSTKNKPNNVLTATVQANASDRNSVTAQTGNALTSDDWNDPKFSEELLDMFCESDSLFEANEEEDDLLYQVCDDIEKQTQSGNIKKGNEKHVLQQEQTVCKSDSSTGLLLEKSRQTCNQHMQSNHQNRNTFLLNNSSKNNSSRGDQGTAQRQMHSLPLKDATSLVPVSNKHGISQNVEKAMFGNQVQGKFNRSHSTPAESFRSVSLAHLQNTTKPLSSSSVEKALIIPPHQKYSFTKIKTSQPTLVLVDHNSAKSESAFQTEPYPQAGESKTLSSFSLHGHLPVDHRQSLKRQLSESFLQSAKVLTAEERSQKCSQEDIERKKREALARLKKRTHSLMKNT
ncbi:ewing's tumor-associated antigen 1 isoform X2 [Ambystoma mexicanum]